MCKTLFLMRKVARRGTRGFRFFYTSCASKTNQTFSNSGLCKYGFLVVKVYYTCYIALLTKVISIRFHPFLPSGLYLDAYMVQNNVCNSSVVICVVVDVVCWYHFYGHRFLGGYFFSLACVVKRSFFQTIQFIPFGRFIASLQSWFFSFFVHDIVNFCVDNLLAYACKFHRQIIWLAVRFIVALVMVVNSSLILVSDFHVILFLVRTHFVSVKLCVWLDISTFAICQQITQVRW